MHELIGKPVPPIELTSSDGKKMPVMSLLGKPVLLDFWASWCAPCVASLPSLERLHRETAGTGLAIISIDEDEYPKTAEDFWTKHNEPWPNFHDNGEIAKQFPAHGIPYFVVINASGRVVFSDSGLDENKLRSALATLGPGFASLVVTPRP
ncbi:MAG TPA: TlpA disulfide reductase family protein [Nitrospiraceae bacterium]